MLMHAQGGRVHLMGSMTKKPVAKGSVNDHALRLLHAAKFLRLQVVDVLGMHTEQKITSQLYRT